MIDIGYYLLKVIIGSGILFLYYHLALRNKLFHQWNRFYLLAATVLSIWLPLLHIHIGQVAGQSKAIKLLQVVSTADEYVVEVSGRNRFLSIESGIYLVYAGVSLLLLATLVLSLLKIRTLLKRYHAQRLHNIEFLNTDAKGTPFSFFHYIFWNRQIDIHSTTGQLIFKHEVVHVQERHTLDKLLIQVVIAAFWCNPFFWLIRKELHMLHEFIADEKAIENQDAHLFAAMLLQTVYPQHYQPLSNPFFQSSIKRRLAMLTKIKNPRFSYLSRLLALPLLLLIGFAFTVKTKAVSNAPTAVLLKEPITVVIDAGHGGSDAGAQAGGINEKDIALAIAKKVKAANTNDQVHILLTRSEDVATNLKDRVDLAAEKKADLFISLHINAAEKPDSSGMEVYVSGKQPPYQAASELFGSALVQQLGTAYTTFPQLRTYTKTGIWVLDHNVCPAVLVECGYMSNEKDRAFVLQEKNQARIAQEILNAIVTFAANRTAVPATITAVDMAALANDDTLPTQTYHGKEIKNLEVKKSQQVVITYKDGTKETLSAQEAKKQKLLLPPPPPPPPPATPVPGKPGHGNSASSNALIVIDGVEKGRVNELGNLDALIKPNEIESLNILKDDAATNKYGDKGKSGVIEIITKKSGAAKDETSIKKEEGNIVFTQTETEAQFPGEAQGWRNYLMQNLDASLPVKKGAPAGNYTVQVQFIVHPDGSLTDIKALTHHGYGMEEEVVQLIKKGPKWIPAEQNGQVVTSIRKQPVTFVISAQ